VLDLAFADRLFRVMDQLKTALPENEFLLIMIFTASASETNSAPPKARRSSR
jgi:hypothetical protein